MTYRKNHMTCQEPSDAGVKKNLECVCVNLWIRNDHKNLILNSHASEKHCVSYYNILSSELIQWNNLGCLNSKPGPYNTNCRSETITSIWGNESRSVTPFDRAKPYLKKSNTKNLKIIINNLTLVNKFKYKMCIFNVLSYSADKKSVKKKRKI